MYKNRVPPSSIHSEYQFSKNSHKLFLNKDKSTKSSKTKNNNGNFKIIQINGQLFTSANASLICILFSRAWAKLMNQLFISHSFANKI